MGLLCTECVSQNRGRAADRHNAFKNTQPHLSHARNGSFFTLNGPLAIKCFAGFVVLILILRSMGLFGYGSLDPVTLTKHSPSASASDPCQGKRACLIMFLAPWCPSCHAAIPFVKAAREHALKDPGLGVQVVIGADDLSELEQMGKEISGAVYYDVDGQIASAISGSGVPRWAVIDMQRKILDYGAGLPSVDASHPGFNDYLKSIKFH